MDISLKAITNLHPLSPKSAHERPKMKHSSLTEAEKVLSSVRLEEEIAKVNIEDLILDYERNKEASFMSDDTEIKVLKSSDQFSKYKDYRNIKSRPVLKDISNNSFSVGDSSDNSTAEEFEEVRRVSRESQEKDSIKLSHLMQQYKMRHNVDEKNKEEAKENQPRSSSTKPSKEFIESKSIIEMKRSDSFMDLKKQVEDISSGPQNNVRKRSVTFDATPKKLQESSVYFDADSSITNNDSTISNTTRHNSSRDFSLESHKSAASTSSATIYTDQSYSVDQEAYGKTIESFDHKMGDLRKFESRLLVELQELKRKKEKTELKTMKREQKLMEKEAELSYREEQLNEKERLLDLKESLVQIEPANSTTVDPIDPEYVKSLELCLNNVIKENYYTKYQNILMHKKLGSSIYVSNYLNYSLKEIYTECLNKIIEPGNFIDEELFRKDQRAFQDPGQEISRIFSLDSSDSKQKGHYHSVNRNLDNLLTKDVRPFRDQGSGKLRVLARFVLGVVRIKNALKTKRQNERKLAKIMKSVFV